MSLTARDQGIFRPHIAPAWLAHCAATDTDPDDVVERELWYHNQVNEVCGVYTTREADSQGGRTARDLAAHFRRIIGFETPFIEAWTEKQNEAFSVLAVKAWVKDMKRSEPQRPPRNAEEFRISAPSVISVVESYEVWLRKRWADAELTNDDIAPWFAPDHIASFERVMADLAVRAGNQKWIERTAKAAELRMRHVIEGMLDRLTELTGTLHTWSYACQIYAHMSAGSWPEINDAPATFLWKILQCLGSHRCHLEKKGTAPQRDAEKIPFDGQFAAPHLRGGAPAESRKGGGACSP